MNNFPVIIQILILGVWMLAVPLLSGGLLSGKFLRTIGLESMPERILFRWCSGQMLLWAGFQIICVPMIICERRLREVVILFLIYSGFLVLGGIIWQWLSRNRKRELRLVREKKKLSLEEKIFWGVFGILLLVQLVCAVFMAYEEGDDAFYVAVSTITNKSDRMYSVLPYTGGVTGLDIRHGLAPMPVWIAFLARMTGLPAVSVAQVAAPVVLIIMAYGMFYLIGAALFGKSGVKLSLFMALTGLLVLFGGYSIYSVENFLLVRTAQGKAILGNIVLPYIFFMVIALLKKILNGESPRVPFWILLMSAVFAGCLCSTQGAMLTAVFLGVAGICIAVSCRKCKFLISTGCCCIPAVCYLLLYVVLS